jgi:hypothetical protein
LEQFGNLPQGLVGVHPVDIDERKIGLPWVAGLELEPPVISPANAQLLLGEGNYQGLGKEEAVGKNYDAQDSPPSSKCRCLPCTAP